MAAAPTAYTAVRHSSGGHLYTVQEEAHAPSAYEPHPSFYDSSLPMQAQGPFYSTVPNSSLPMQAQGPFYSTVPNTTTYGASRPATISSGVQQWVYHPTITHAAAPQVAPIAVPPGAYLTPVPQPATIPSGVQQWVYQPAITHTAAPPVTSIAVPPGAYLAPVPQTQTAPALMHPGPQLTSVKAQHGTPITQAMAQPSSHVPPAATLQPPSSTVPLIMSGDGAPIGEPLLKATQDGKMAPVQTAVPRGKRSGHRRKYPRTSGAIGEPLISEAMMRNLESQSKRAKYVDSSSE